MTQSTKTLSTAEKFTLVLDLLEEWRSSNTTPERKAEIKQELAELGYKRSLG